MTVAISCNLSEGVILGVDSAASVPGPGGYAKVYENAQKLFQLAERPIGVAVFGLGGLGTRSIGSYLQEFELRNPGNMVSGPSNLQSIAEALRVFFLEAYHATVVPALEAAAGIPFAQIPVDQRPYLGLVLGGFSSDAYLSEVWQINVPLNDQPGTAVAVRAQGNFGTNWFAMFEPIRRYVLGFDPQLAAKVATFSRKMKGADLTPAELQELAAVFREVEYKVPFAAMPLEEGVIHTRFLVEMVINHHRFVLGAPVVGGKARIGKVSYRGGRFQILE